MKALYLLAISVGMGAIAFSLVTTSDLVNTVINFAGTTLFFIGLELTYSNYVQEYKKKRKDLDDALARIKKIDSLASTEGINAANIAEIEAVD